MSTVFGLYSVSCPKKTRNYTPHDFFVNGPVTTGLRRPTAHPPGRGATGVRIVAGPSILPRDAVSVPSAAGAAAAERVRTRGSNGVVSSPGPRVLSAELAGARCAHARCNLCRAPGQVHRQLAGEHRNGLLVHQSLCGMRVGMYVLLRPLRSPVRRRARSQQRAVGRRRFRTAQ